MMTLHDISSQTLRVHPINYMTSTASILSDLDLHNDLTNGLRIGKRVKRMIVTILMMNYCKPEDRLDLTEEVMSQCQSSSTCGHDCKLHIACDSTSLNM